MRSRTTPQNDPAPHALARRSLIRVEVTPEELHMLVLALEARAAAYIDFDDSYADYLLTRVAALREAGR